MAAKKKSPDSPVATTAPSTKVEAGTPRRVRPRPTSGEASAELHHAPVEPATPAHPFDDATVDVSGDRAFEALTGIPPARHEALVLAWIARRNAAAIAGIASRDDAPATARKAARRAVGVLKSRGIAVPERSSVVNLVQKPTHSFEARCLFPDGRGAQLWWIARVSSTGATDVVEVTTVDRSGVVSLQRGNPSAGNLRQLWQSWLGRNGRAPAEVPVDWTRYRIAHARRQSEKQKQVLPMGLDAARELLGVYPEVADRAVPHPIDQEELAVPSEEAAVKARLGASMHLHEEPEFGSWLPEDTAGVAFLEAINAKLQQLSDEERKDQSQVDVAVREVIDQAADAYFSEERKGLYVERMRDAAWSLYRAGLVDRAIDALLVADAIRKAGVISERPSEIPFVRGMFLKLLAVAQQRAGAMTPRGDEEAERLA